MEDERIIDLYWAREERAIEETRGKYGAYCLAVSENILHSREDAEECVSDTWLRAWNAMPPQRPGNLKFFLARITRNLSINRFAGQTAAKRGGRETALILDELSECLASGETVEEAVQTAELEESIGAFVRGLSVRDGNVFVRRYFFADSMAQIAARFGITEDHAAVLLSRTRKKLKKQLIREGYIYE